MLMPNVKGHLFAVALFLVCCWVNPNDAIPYRTRPQVKDQVDHRVGNRAETSAVQFAHRAIGQPDLGADKKPALSGGGKKWRSLQPLRSPRSRIKNANTGANVNINVNRNGMGRINRPMGRLAKIGSLNSRYPKIGLSNSRFSKIGKSNNGMSKFGQLFARGPMKNVEITTEESQNVSKPRIEPLIVEATNCSGPHNEDDRYSSSFNVNSSLTALNASDDFQVTGEEEGPKQTSSVHIGEDITLCWIETTTIKEDHTVHPVQRLVIREYTISFENSATIPERYLECIQLEGEVDGKNSTPPRSALFEVIDENTHHSRVVNFTTVSHSDDLIVWQHKRVRCGVGPVVTKNIIEWPDDKSDNPKKRVEIKVSPKIHKLIAYPTDTEPCTTDLIDSSLNFTTSINPSSPVDCIDENCDDSTVSYASSDSSVFQDEITPSYIPTSDADDKTDRLTDTTDDYGSSELLSTPATEVQLLVTDEMIHSLEEITTADSATDDARSTVRPVEVTTIVGGDTLMTISDFEMPSSTESSTVLSVTLTPEPGTSVETGNQEVEIPGSSEESSSGASEIDESCESGESCAEYPSESVTASSEELSNSEMETDDTTIPGDGETDNTGDFSPTPTTDASAAHMSKSTTEDDSDYLSIEEWDTTTEPTELETSITTIETIETSQLHTESSFTTTETMDSNMTVSPTTDIDMGTTESSEIIISITQTTAGTSESTTSIQCDNGSDDCAELTEITVDEDQTDSTESVTGSTFTPTTMTTLAKIGTTTLASIKNVIVPKVKTTTGFPLSTVSITEVSTIEVSGMDEDRMNETLSTASTGEASTTEEATTVKSLPASCEDSESCDSGSENENTSIVVPGGLSAEECENENGTVTCRPSSDRPGEITEIIETKATDVAEMMTTMTTRTDLLTSSDGSTTSHSDTTMEETTIDISSSSGQVTTPTDRLDGETTTEETTTEKRSPATCENNELCDSSSENESSGIGESSTEKCSIENGMVNCGPISDRPVITTELVEMQTIDVTKTTITMTAETDLLSSSDLSTTSHGDTTWKETTMDISGSIDEVTMSTIRSDGETTTKETTTEKPVSATCTDSESCDSSSETEDSNIVVPGGSSVEECDNENGTTSCRPTPTRPGDTTEIAQSKTTDVAEVTMTMTTETDLPPSSGLSTTSRDETVVEETTTYISDSNDEVTTPVIRLDGETTTGETTTEKQLSATCANSESCDSSSENENSNIVVPGDSSVEECDNENGTVSCRPISSRPGDTTEIVQIQTTDVTEMMMPMTTETNLPTSSGLSTTSRDGTTVKETTIHISGPNDEVTTPVITLDGETTMAETTTEKRSSTTCENSESCDSSSENENIVVPGDSSAEDCDNENGTVSCRPISSRPGDTTETVEIKTTDVTEMTMTMTTETDLPTSSGLSTTSRDDTTVKEITIHISSSNDEVTVPVITLDGETTTEETSSENENSSVVVPGDSSAEDCDNENGTASCRPVSSKPGDTTEMVEIKTTDVTEITMTIATETDLPTSSDETIDDSATSHDGMTVKETPTVETITEISQATIEVTTASSTSRGENTTEESTTTEVTMLETRLGTERTTEAITTDMIDATTPVTMVLTTLSGENTMEISMINITESTTESTTMATRVGGERSTEVTIARISDATIGVAASSTTENDQSEFIVSSSEGTTQTSTELYSKGSTMDIGDAPTEKTTYTTDSDVNESWGTVLMTTAEDSDLGTTTGTSSTTENDQSEFIVSSTEGTAQTSAELYSEGSTMDIGDALTGKTTYTTDSDIKESMVTVLVTTAEESDFGTTTETNSTEDLEYIQELSTSGITEIVFTTTDATEDRFTPNVGDGDTETTIETVTVSSNEEATSIYSTVSSSQVGATTEEPENVTSSCDASTGECNTTKTVDVTPITSQSCDSDSSGCDTTDESSTSSCDQESGNCSTDLSSSSETSCDEESDGCTISSSSASTVVCDDESSSSCVATSESQEYSTTVETPKKCNNSETGNCTMPPQTQDITDMPSATSSTPVEVENISTTVSDVPTTVDSRRTTTLTAASNDPGSGHKLALTIKILLEHIDENQKKQQLYEIEKHLLFDEHPEDHGRQSLMKQVRSLNNTVSMQTVQALFNCSKVEKLTGDVGDFAAKYLEMQDKIRKIHVSSNNLSSSSGLHMRKSRNLSHPAKPETDPDLEMSLPGIHADIHSGLSHVMTRVQSENEVVQQSVGVSEEDHPPSRILEVVADPRDKRVGARRKRQTMEDLMIDQHDLPKDVTEVGHWSNERVRRAINGGHVRTLTEFTIYRGS